MNSIKKLQNTITKSPIGKSIDNNHKQWSSDIVRIRFKTGISGIVQEDQKKRMKHLPNA